VSEDRRVAGAALCLSAALLWLALPERAPDASDWREAGGAGLAGRLDAARRMRAAACELAPVRGPARRLFGLPLDPNRASPASLETLRGSGPGEGGGHRRGAGQGSLLRDLRPRARPRDRPPHAREALGTRGDRPNLMY